MSKNANAKLWWLLIGLVTLSPFAPAYAGVPAVDPAACRALVNTTADADVAYKPGVDVEGNAVVPADLPGSQQIKLPAKINFPLTLNLAKALNLDTTTYPYNQLGQGTEAQLGTLTVEGNSVSFNGQPLSDEQQAKLAALCAHRK